MSQSKTSWTRLFHSPVGFVQDVPYSEPLSYWPVRSIYHWPEGLRGRMIVKFHQLQRRKKKTYQKCSIVTLYAIWIGTGIIHLPFDSVYVKTLLREWPLFLRKGGGRLGNFFVVVVIALFEKRVGNFFWATNNFLGSSCAGIFLW